MGSLPLVQPIRAKAGLRTIVLLSIVACLIEMASPVPLASTHENLKADDVLKLPSDSKDKMSSDPQRQYPFEIPNYRVDLFLSSHPDRKLHRADAHRKLGFGCNVEVTEVIEFKTHIKYSEEKPSLEALKEKEEAEKEKEKEEEAKKKEEESRHRREKVKPTVAFPKGRLIPVKGFDGVSMFEPSFLETTALKANETDVHRLRVARVVSEIGNFDGIAFGDIYCNGTDNACADFNMESQTEKRNTWRVEWSFPRDGKSRKITLKYVVKGLVWGDGKEAVFEWTAVGSEWEGPVARAQINVTIPGDWNKRQVKAHPAFNLMHPQAPHEAISGPSRKGHHSKSHTASASSSSSSHLHHHHLEVLSSSTSSSSPSDQDKHDVQTSKHGEPITSVLFKKEKFSVGEPFMVYMRFPETDVLGCGVTPSWYYPVLVISIIFGLVALIAAAIGVLFLKTFLTEFDFSQASNRMGRKVRMWMKGTHSRG